MEGRTSARHFQRHANKALAREAVGVVGVTPWNFPHHQFKLGPMLAAGNTAVLKPVKRRTKNETKTRCA